MASTTEQPRSPAHQPTRRALLAGAASTPVLALPAVAGAAGPEPDPHPAWLAEWQACQDAMNGPAGNAVDCLSELPEWRRALDLEGLIGMTPARTLAGAVAQMRLLAWYDTQYTPASDATGATVGNVLATLERLAGEARA